jgi:hypothetical protein
MQDGRTRALGYVPRRREGQGRFTAEVQALERGCTRLGLTLVGIVTDDEAADVPNDVDYVVVTELDGDDHLEEALAGLVGRSAPLVVLAQCEEAGDA